MGYFDGLLNAGKRSATKYGHPYISFTLGQFVEIGRGTLCLNRVLDT